MIFEKLWHNEVKESPQLCHAVLDRSTREEKTVPGLELQKDFPATGCVILDGLRLVENHVVPFDLHQLCLVLLVVHDQVVGGDDHVDLQGGVHQILWVQEFGKLLSFLLVPEVWQHL